MGGYEACTVIGSKIHGFSVRMSPKSPNLQLLGETLTRHYRLACELFNTYPVGRFTHQFSQGSLDLNLSEIDLEQLEALCHTLQNKIAPLNIHIYIPDGKEAALKVIHRILQGISICLSKSLILSTLELYNIKLKGKNLNIFCQGLMKSQNLKILSFNKCELGDAGVAQMCQSIKNVPSITQLQLINCLLAEKGTFAVANLIQHQRMNRDSAMWQDTLRLRQPHLDGMKGLRRITLNNNPRLNDKGAVAIANALAEDLWIKALDLQHCGIGDEGGLMLRNVINTNQTLEILDLRQNPFVPSQLVEDIKEVLKNRQDKYNIQFMWLEPSENDQTKQEATAKTTGSPGRYSATSRINNIKKVGHHAIYTPPKQIPKPPGQLGIPWRVEHRLFERREGLAPGSVVDAFHKDQQNYAVDSNTSQPPDVEDALNLLTLRKQLSLYKRKYQKERERRKRMEKKLSRLQEQLKGFHLLDEETVSHIEACFLKFQTFLSHLQNTEVWQSSLFQDLKRRNVANDILQPSICPSVTFGNLHSNKSWASNKKVQNSHHSLTIPIPIILNNKPCAEDELFSSEQVLEINEVKTGKIMQTPGSTSFTLNLEPTDKLKSSVTARKDDSPLEELHDYIQAGRNMLSLQSNGELQENVTGGGNDIILTEDKEEISEEEDTEKRFLNEEDTTMKKFSNDREDIKDFFPKEVENTTKKCSSKVYGNGEKFSNKVVVGTEENMVSSLDLKKGSVQEGIKMKLNKKSASGKNDCNTVNTSSVNKDKPVMKENELLMANCEKEYGSNTEKHEDHVNKQDIFNKTRDNVESETDWIDLKSKNPKDNTHGRDFVKANNTLTNLNMRVPDRHDNVSFKQKFSGKEKSTSANTTKSVQVNTFQKLANEIQFSYEDTVNGRQISQITENFQNNDVSETDDEKLKMQKTTFIWLNRSGSGSSSVSITEHLSHSHSHWSKSSQKKPNKHGSSEHSSDIAPQLEMPGNKGDDEGKCDGFKLNSPSPAAVQNDNDLVEYDSDFEISDVEGLSISPSSLASTSIPDDLLTPGEEEF
ncbi:uncharacterized protein LOC121865002 isoform X2 [Homarus americanus]|uniref:uncharacterized protein LOC121865002 isoform X2 n=1 Tax=Homarus americanus TaxID=6706 RepID=UPI001C474AB3|nr:uncharacterized protein LOC121865002 isoform X2 [Homarus americanus]